MHRIRTLFSTGPGLVLSALLAVGCLLASALTPRVHAEGVNPPLERQAVPSFAVQTLDGATWRLADHHGEVVLVNLFATWCPPCRAEMPGLVQTIDAYRSKGLTALAVSLDEGGANVVRPFASKYKMDFPVALPGAEASITEGVSSIPVTLLLDRHGRLARSYVGMVQESELKGDLDRLLAEKD